MRQIETDVQSPLPIPDKIQAGRFTDYLRRNSLQARITRWLNRGLPDDRGIEVRIAWPFWLIPIVLLNQLIAPHVVWVATLITLSGFYAVGYLWIRNQAPAISLTRRRLGSILVAGDLLQEEFEISNSSALPLLWAEFVDHSNVPDYQVGRVVACEGNSFYRWRTEVLCKQRGLFRLRPHSLRLQDPFGLFSVTIADNSEDIVLIYPRVVHLPRVELPRGNSQGGDRQRRPLPGNLPAATISDYRPGDSLRFVHWASTARRGRMMVKELEIEPSGNLWLVLDLDARVQQGEGIAGTLEHGIVVAASLAAELLSGRDHRSVGLLAYSGEEPGIGRSGLVEVLPAEGTAHTWPILTALAPVTAGDLPLAALLSSSSATIGPRSTLTVITPVPSAALGEEGGGSDSGNAPASASMMRWIAELVHLKSVGVESSVVLIAPVEGDPKASDAMRALLARLEIPSTVLAAGAMLPALLTFRRRRRVVRTTPTGGAVSYEVDEEVG